MNWARGGWTMQELHHWSGASSFLTEEDNLDDYLQLFGELLEKVCPNPSDVDQLSVITARTLAGNLWRWDWCNREAASWRTLVDQAGTREVARLHAFAEADELFRIRQVRIHCIDQTLKLNADLRRSLEEPLEPPMGKVLNMKGRS
ncbi:MAG: hypothetical protein GY788_20935 [bacterium]|nr:hypothetical protein [bacterium]